MPRTRGGLPVLEIASRNPSSFAPHTRGSTVGEAGPLSMTGVCPAHAGVYPCPARPGQAAPHHVCPAHAGVYLRRTRPAGMHRRLPRTRGGLPSPLSLKGRDIAFAPHTRGSTHRSHGSHAGSQVCPAHAGVYRHDASGRDDGLRLPRTRGGLQRLEAPFAPHTRGSTVTTPAGGMMVSVCPAHAGVYRGGRRLWLLR